MTRSLHSGIGLSLAAAALIGMGAGYGSMPSAGLQPSPSRKRRVQSAPYRAPNEIDTRPQAEAKRERKRMKRLADQQKGG
jgi:hypothetical protein